MLICLLFAKFRIEIIEHYEYCTIASLPRVGIIGNIVNIFSRIQSKLPKLPKLNYDISSKLISTCGTLMRRHFESVLSTLPINE